VRVVADPVTLQSFAGGDTRVMVELMTSTGRHGMLATDLSAVLTLLAEIRLAGFALHLPLSPARGNDPRTEVERWISQLKDLGIHHPTLWVSHLTAHQLQQLRDAYPAATFRPRIGTALWLGEPSAMTVRSTVYDVHPVRRGQRYGYRQRAAPYNGHLLVLAGGTAHGLTLEAPRFVSGIRARLRFAAEVGMAQANWTRSPFTIDGSKRMLAEPPHMQVCLVLIPASVNPPDIGAQVPVTIRATTVRVDRVIDE
jgi:hypothetical protein